MNQVCLLLTNAVLIVLMTACASRPAVVDIPVAAIKAGKGTVTDQEVKDALTRAATGLGWSISDDGPGKLVGQKVQKKQTAIVGIDYQASMYSIRYRDSSNMKYTREPSADMAGAIHDPDYATIEKAYNDWVQALDQAIQRELANLR